MVLLILTECIRWEIPVAIQAAPTPARSARLNARCSRFFKGCCLSDKSRARALGLAHHRTRVGLAQVVARPAVPHLSERRHFFAP